MPGVGQRYPPPAGDILDSGCGIGGSALVLATRFNARVTGITLSPIQANRARERAARADLSGDTAPCARFEVTDALHTPFPDQSFDFVWSMESGETHARQSWPAAGVLPPAQAGGANC